jgi:hypothetical protein
MTIGKTKGFTRGKNCAVRIRNFALHPCLAARAHPGGKVQISKAESRNKNNRRYREVETFQLLVNLIGATVQACSSTNMAAVERSQ